MRVYSGHLELYFTYAKTISTIFAAIDIYSIAHLRNNINSLWNNYFNIYRLFIV